MALLGLITDEGLYYSKEAASNEGWNIIPTGFAVSETAGTLVGTRTYATMNTVWYSGLISGKIVEDIYTIKFVCTIPPGSALVRINVGEIYLTASYLGTYFLLSLAQPTASLIYDPTGALTFRLQIKITNVNIADNYEFSYTQATEITDHNIDPNAHPDFQPYFFGKIKVSAGDELDYLINKLDNTFTVEERDSSDDSDLITIADDSILERYLNIYNDPTDEYSLCWSDVQNQMVWRTRTPEIITRYVNTYSSNVTWTVVHNLNSYNLIVECWDTAYNLLTPTGIVCDNLNQVTITFAGAKAGRVVIISLPSATFGIDYWHEYNSDSWDVVHFLDSEYTIIGVWENTDSTGEYSLIPNYILKNNFNEITVDWGGNIVQGFVVVADLTDVDTGVYKEAVHSKYMGQWAINHALSNDNIMVFVWGDDNKLIEPNYVEKVDSNNLLVDFDGTINGSIIVVSTDINIEGLDTYSHTYVAAVSWTVTHNLGTERIIVQCWDSNDRIVYPYDITIDSDNQVTVDWNGVSVGGKVFVFNISTS